MAKLWMAERLWFNLLNTALMLSEFTRGEYLNQSSHLKKDQDQEALVQDIGMIIGRKIIEGEAAVGAEKGLIKIGIVERTEITIVEAGATVEVQTTTKLMVKESMMMKDGAEVEAEAEADLMEVRVAHLVEQVLVLGEAPLLEHLQRVRARVDELMRRGLQLQGVPHHVGDQLIPVVSPLANLMWMSKHRCLELIL